MVTIGILANFIVSQSHYSIGRDYAAVASAEIQIFALGRAIKKRRKPETPGNPTQVSLGCQNRSQNTSFFYLAAYQTIEDIRNFLGPISCPSQGTA
jgi:hypothetical protein